MLLKDKAKRLLLWHTLTQGTYVWKWHVSVHLHTWGCPFPAQFPSESLDNDILSMSRNLSNTLTGLRWLSDIPSSVSGTLYSHAPCRLTLLFNNTWLGLQKDLDVVRVRYPPLSPDLQPS